MSRFAIRTQLWFLSLALVIGFTFFGAGTWKTLSDIKVGGPAYQRIVLYKDLVADILPPPNYIIESYLTVLLLSDPDRISQQPELIARLTKLRAEYDTRHRFWLEQQLPEPLKKTFLDSAHTPAKAFFEIAEKEFVPHVKAGQMASAAVVLQQLERLYLQHRQAVDQVVGLAIKEQEQIELDTANILKIDSWTLVSVFIASILTTLAVNLAFGRSLRSGITQVQEALDQLGQGNLTHSAQSDRGDELGTLIQAANSSIHRLRQTVGSILQTASSVSVSATQLSNAIQEVASSSEHQSNAVVSVAATVEEMSAGIAQMADSSTDSHQRAAHAGEACQQGSHQIESTVSVVERLAQDVQVTANSINTLGEASSQISTIISAIREIADQTNLLALNAAIEAARAGEQGRGFAVVADEVRKLAERTATSTDQIGSMIGHIQSGISQAVTSMSEGSERARTSIDVVQRARNTMQGIATETNELMRDIDEISAALQTQRVGSHQIASEVERIAASSEENSQAAQQMAGTARDLSGLSSRLREAVSFFRC